MIEPLPEVVVAGIELLALPRITSGNGSLIVAEIGAGLPFVARRVFTLLQVPSDEKRGMHAHRQCAQFLICMAGSVIAVVDDGTHRQEFLLDDPAIGFYMPPLTWGTQYGYSHDAILVVLASDPYDAEDYIHEYAEFKEIVAGRPV